MLATTKWFPSFELPRLCCLFTAIETLTKTEVGMRDCNIAVIGWAMFSLGKYRILWAIIAIEHFKWRPGQKVFRGEEF